MTYTARLDNAPMTTTQEPEVMAWLGDVATDMSDEELDQFHLAWHQIFELFPDDADEREELLSSACLAITHGIDLESARLGREALRWRVVEAVRDGLSEAEVARSADVDRSTVRRWLGKQ